MWCSEDIFHLPRLQSGWQPWPGDLWHNPVSGRSNLEIAAKASIIMYAGTRPDLLDSWGRKFTEIIVGKVSNNVRLSLLVSTGLWKFL